VGDRHDLTPTPGQTVGPFFAFALEYPGCAELVPPHRAGAIRLHGHVLDGMGVPVPDAVVEIWQRDELGAIPHEAGSLHRDGYTFSGFGRSATDALGHYQFTTVVPGAVPGRPSHFAVVVFARGLLDTLHTRIYLPGTQRDADALLASLDDERWRTLLATEDGAGSLRFDIRLQGKAETGHAETVFLDFR
jgi:protocatechuate 3,4-dioxygenase alpha subunit